VSPAVGTRRFKNASGDIAAEVLHLLLDALVRTVEVEVSEARAAHVAETEEESPVRNAAKDDVLGRHGAKLRRRVVIVDSERLLSRLVEFPAVRQVAQGLGEQVTTQT